MACERLPIWTFDGVSFFVQDLNDWSPREAKEVSLPLNAVHDIITALGWHSDERLLSVLVRDGAKDSLRGKFTSRTVGTLTDSRGTSTTARIMEWAGIEQLTPNTWRVDVLFKKRPAP